MPIIVYNMETFEGTEYPSMEAAFGPPPAFVSPKNKLRPGRFYQLEDLRCERVMRVLLRKSDGCPGYIFQPTRREDRCQYGDSIRVTDKMLEDGYFGLYATGTFEDLCWQEVA